MKFTIKSNFIMNDIFISQNLFCISDKISKHSHRAGKKKGRKRKGKYMIDLFLIKVLLIFFFKNYENSEFRIFSLRYFPVNFRECNEHFNIKIFEVLFNIERDLVKG